MSKKPSWQRAIWFKPRPPGRVPSFIGDRRVGFMHAHKDGAPVLRSESSWRTINGVYVNTKWGWLRVLFRRIG